jgi:hypothetical protein
MLTAIQLYDLCNLDVDSFRFCDRRPSLNYFPIFVDKEFLEIPLGDNFSRRVIYCKFWKRTLISVIPNNPDFSFLSHLNTSFVASPFTSDFFMRGKVTPWLMVQNSWMALSPSGSWLPNYSLRLLLDWKKESYVVCILGCRESR